jgi:hypothetical protein
MASRGRPTAIQSPIQVRSRPDSLPGVITVLGPNLLGDGLRDVLDPRIKVER